MFTNGYDSCPRYIRFHTKLQSFFFHQGSKNPGQIKMTLRLNFTVHKRIFKNKKSASKVKLGLFYDVTWTISTPWHEMKATKLTSKNVIKAQFIGIFVISLRLSSRRIKKMRTPKKLLLFFRRERRTGIRILRNLHLKIGSKKKATPCIFSLPGGLPSINLFWVCCMDCHFQIIA